MGLLTGVLVLRERNTDIPMRVPIHPSSLHAQSLKTGRPREPSVCQTVGWVQEGAKLLWSSPGLTCYTNPTNAGGTPRTLHTVDPCYPRSSDLRERGRVSRKTRWRVEDLTLANAQ